MSDLAGLFVNNLLPILLAAAAGYPLGKWLKVNPRSLSQVTFYIFSPCLVFRLLTTTKLSYGDILLMVGLAVVVAVIVGSLAWGAGRLLKLEHSMLMAVIVTSMFMNAGNFGLPVNLFAFGEQAVTYASVYFITSSILNNTVGVVIASMGKSTLLHSFLGLFKLPTVYSLILALLLNGFGWSVPAPLNRTISILADAAIPSMLVMMGLQLQNMQWKGQGIPLTITGIMRLGVAPLLAMGFTLLFGLKGPARQAGILESAMPTAVLNTVLATEYDLEPSYVTSAVFISTLLSPFVLTPLLLYLR